MEKNYTIWNNGVNTWSSPKPAPSLPHFSDGSSIYSYLSQKNPWEPSLYCLPFSTPHLQSIRKFCLFYLLNLFRIWPLLTTSNVTILVPATLSSQLDHCRCCLSTLPASSFALYMVYSDFIRMLTSLLYSKPYNTPHFTQSKNQSSYIAWISPEHLLCPHLLLLPIPTLLTEDLPYHSPCSLNMPSTVMPCALECSSLRYLHVWLTPCSKCSNVTVSNESSSLLIFLTHLLPLNLLCFPLFVYYLLPMTNYTGYLSIFFLVSLPSLKYKHKHLDYFVYQCIPHDSNKCLAHTKHFINIAERINEISVPLIRKRMVRGVKMLSQAVLRQGICQTILIPLYFSFLICKTGVIIVPAL